MINRLRPSYWILDLFFLLALPASPVFAVKPVFTNFLGQAIRGYDPVAYFKEGQPVEGKSAFQTEWKGAKWRFATQENLDADKNWPDLLADNYKAR